MPRFILFFANVCLLFSSGVSSISRQECQDQGGEVVGDIGDGAIFGPDYICENNGLPPTDPVMASAGEPIAIEGEVCCGGTGEGIAFMSDGLGSQNETAIPVNTTDRDVYSRQECLDNGGVVVGDIGDGSIFQPDYICEISGQPPVADIGQTEEPFAIEGEVCCGQGIVPISDGLGDQNDTAILNATDRDVYTRQECIDDGDLVVGDIGDGSIFQPDYICESSGEVPLGNIVQTGEALAMEGEVCCEVFVVVDCSASFSPFVSLVFFNVLLVWNLA